jgi:hypothetical protein
VREAKLTVLGSVLIGLASVATATGLPPFTVNDARELPIPQLAKDLLGERLGSRVIEASRHEYDGSSSSTPQYVEFFTQPELSAPVLNGICRTDVIIVEYNWFELDGAAPSTPLKIARIAAKSRFKSFPEPAGDPGSDEYDRAQTAACAAMRTAKDAFRAPSGGDAQWLAAIHREYSNPTSRFTFGCKDFADASCGKARVALGGLDLNKATDVQHIDCPKVRTGDQVDYCYRLTFPYAGETRFPEIGDYEDVGGSPEWIITVFAGMRDGMAPVQIRSLQLEHLPKPIAIP